MEEMIMWYDVTKFDLTFSDLIDEEKRKETVERILDEFKSKMDIDKNDIIIIGDFNCDDCYNPNIVYPESEKLNYEEILNQYRKKLNDMSTDDSDIFNALITEGKDFIKNYIENKFDAKIYIDLTPNL